MIYPHADKLDALESKYALVIVAAKRSRQIKEGARRYTDSKSTNPLTLALEEIADDKITNILIGEPEKLPTSVAATPVLGGLVSTMMDEDYSQDSTAAEINALLSGDDDEEDDDEIDEINRPDSGMSVVDLGRDGEVAVYANDDDDDSGMDVDDDDSAIDPSDTDDEDEEE